MNDDSSLRSSRVMLTAGIVICSLLAVVSIINPGRGRTPRLLSVSPKSNEVTEANRQLTESYSEFYPDSAASSRFPVRTISHSTEASNQQSVSASDGNESKQVVEHRDVFQKDQVVDAVDVAKDEFRKSLRHFSTTTVVEKNAPAAEGVSIEPSAAIPGRPAIAPPHITVPVTVNVDNGEILSELMRIQEEVQVTRTQLDEIAGHNPKPSTQPAPSVVSSPEEAEPNFDSVAPRMVEPSEPVSAELSEPARITSNSSDAKPLVIQPAPAPSAATPAEPAMPEFSAFEPEAPTAAPSPETTPEMTFEPDEPAESVKQSESGSAAKSSEEMPELDDFATPNPGPSDETIEEELPKFELPSQTSRPRREASVNSYAEWIQSFEEPNELATVTPTSYQTEEPLPELPSADQPSADQPSADQPAFDMTEDDQSQIREAAEPLIQVPDFQPAGPTTAVPAVPVSKSSPFVEPGTIPVFPVTETSSEPVMAPPEFEFAIPNNSTVSQSTDASTATATKQPQLQRVHAEVPSQTVKAPAKNAPASTNATSVSTGRKVTSKSGNNNRTVSAHKANVVAQRRSAASTGKPQASGNTQGDKNSNGMLSKFSTVKSKLSNAVARVPKPDLDTPMWVDRLADWKDERFGKKNATAPQTAMPQQAIARNQPGANATQPPAQRQVARTAPVERRSTTHPPASTDSTSGRVAKSGFRPRPNVTTVPRSGGAPAQIQTAQLQKQPLSSPKQQSVQVTSTPVNSAPVQEQGLQTAAMQTAQNENQQFPGMPVVTIPVQKDEAPAEFVQSTQPQPVQQPEAPVVAAIGPTTPVPPRPQMSPSTQPNTSSAQPSVANAGYRQDIAQPAPTQVAQMAHAEAPAQAPFVQGVSHSDEFALQPSTMHQSASQADLPQSYASQANVPRALPSRPYPQTIRQASASQAAPQRSAAPQRTVVTHTYQPAPHPNAYPATLQRYVSHSNDSGSSYATSQRAYGKQSAVQPSQRVSRPVAVSEPTEYVGTLDAFNMRMTMVIRPPSLANFGRRPVSQSFSSSESMTPAQSSPTLHRVSSSMRYATQPRTIR